MGIDVDYRLINTVYGFLEDGCPPTDEKIQNLIREKDFSDQKVDALNHSLKQLGDKPKLKAVTQIFRKILCGVDELEEKRAFNEEESMDLFLSKLKNTIQFIKDQEEFLSENDLLLIKEMRRPGLVRRLEALHAIGQIYVDNLSVDELRDDTILRLQQFHRVDLLELLRISEDGRFDTNPKLSPILENIFFYALTYRHLESIPESEIVIKIATAKNILCRIAKVQVNKITQFMKNHALEIIKNIPRPSSLKDDLFLSRKDEDLYLYFAETVSPGEDLKELIMLLIAMDELQVAERLIRNARFEFLECNWPKTSHPLGGLFSLSLVARAYVAKGQLLEAERYIHETTCCESNEALADRLKDEIRTYLDKKDQHHDLNFIRYLFTQEYGDSGLREIGSIFMRRMLRSDLLLGGLEGAYGENSLNKALAVVGGEKQAFSDIEAALCSRLLFQQGMIDLLNDLKQRLEVALKRDSMPKAIPA